MADVAEVRFSIPPEHEAGVYANNVALWHTPFEFNLDLAVAQRPEPSDDTDDPDVLPFQVVARVRIPLTLLFELLKALNRQLAIYEADGERSKPAAPRRRRTR